MAFPFVTEENFEGGTYASTHFDATNGAGISVASYRTLAALLNVPSPYRGAYCMRVDIPSVAMPGGFAYFQETGSWDIATGAAEMYFRFAFFASSDLVMANNNEFTIFILVSAAGDECQVVVNYTTANGYRIGIGETGGAQFQSFSLGEWHTIEVYYNPAAAAGGTIDGWLDNVAFTQVGGLTHATTTSGSVGVFNLDAGTTSGTLLFDDIVSDDTRIYPRTSRWANPVLMTRSGHVFVGPGTIDNITLMSGAGADNTISIFDTDTADTNDANNIVVELKNTANREVVTPAGPPVNVKNGCYVSMSGTNPRALVQIGVANAWGSDGAVFQYGGRSR